MFKALDGCILKYDEPVLFKDIEPGECFSLHRDSVLYVKMKPLSIASFYYNAVNDEGQFKQLFPHDTVKRLRLASSRPTIKDLNVGDIFKIDSEGTSYIKIDEIYIGDALYNCVSLHSKQVCNCSNVRTIIKV